MPVRGTDRNIFNIKPSNTSNTAITSNAYTHCVSARVSSKTRSVTAYRGMKIGVSLLVLAQGDTIASSSSTVKVKVNITQASLNISQQCTTSVFNTEIKKLYGSTLTMVHVVILDWPKQLLM